MYRVFAYSYAKGELEKVQAHAGIGGELIYLEFLSGNLVFVSYDKASLKKYKHMLE